MKRIIRIDRADGEVTVEADAACDVVLLAVELGQLAMSFGLGAADARRLGEALVRAAGELACKGGGRGEGR